MGWKGVQHCINTSVVVFPGNVPGTVFPIERKGQERGRENTFAEPAIVCYYISALRKNLFPVPHILF